MNFIGQCLVLEKFVFLSCLCVVFAIYFMCDETMFLPYCYEVLYCLFEYIVFCLVSRVSLKVLDSCVC
jgi:hypothetical protein